MKNLKLITLLSLLSTSIGLHAGCWMPESDTVKNHYKGKDGGYITIQAINPNEPKPLRKLVERYGNGNQKYGHLRDRHTEYISNMRLKEKLPQTDPRRIAIEERWKNIYPVWGDRPLRTYYLRLKGKHKWQWELKKEYIEGAVYTMGVGFLAMPGMAAFDARSDRLFVPVGSDVKHLYQSPPNEPLLTLIKKYWPHLENISVIPSLARNFPCYITTTDAAFERWKKNLKYLSSEERKKQQAEQEKIRKQQEIEERMKVHL